MGVRHQAFIEVLGRAKTPPCREGECLVVAHALFTGIPVAQARKELKPFFMPGTSRRQPGYNRSEYVSLMLKDGGFYAVLRGLESSQRQYRIECVPFARASLVFMHGHAYYVDQTGRRHDELPNFPKDNRVRAIGYLGHSRDLP